jgi:hypothetical protein
VKEREGRRYTMLTAMVFALLIEAPGILERKSLMTNADCGESEGNLEDVDWELVVVGEERHLFLRWRCLWMMVVVYFEGVM